MGNSSDSTLNLSRQDAAELEVHRGRLRLRLFSEPDGYEQVLIEWQIEAVEALIRHELNRTPSSDGADG